MSNFPITDCYARGIANLLVRKLENSTSEEKAQFVQRLFNEIGHNKETIVYSIEQKNIEWLSGHFLACPVLAHRTLSALSFLRPSQK